MPLDTQAGWKTESSYGTAVVVDRFMPFSHSLGSIKPEKVYIESNSMRAGARVQSSTSGAPYIGGAGGQIELEVCNKGFGWWLRHMLGAVATTGPTDSAYTHTGTVASLCGDAFTYQENWKTGACGDGDQAMTFFGGKIAKWELSCDVGGLLIFKADLLFKSFTTATALASASYPSGLEALSWAGASLSVDSTDVPVTGWKVTCDNKLKADRRYLQNDTGRAEPVEVDFRDIQIEFTCDWDDLTHYNKFRSATAAGALAEIACSAESPTLIGTSSKASLAVTAPAARIDMADVSGSGREYLTQTITAKVLDNGSDEPLEVAYVTAESTP